MNYHILEQEAKKKNVRCVFHVPVPAAGTNEAEISWRDAVVLEQGGSGAIVSVLADITPAEDTQLKAGEIIEKVTTVKFSSVNLTAGQKKAQIEAAFNSLKDDLVSEKQVELEWFGYKGDVS